jgi:hypothetical protein
MKSVRALEKAGFVRFILADMRVAILRSHGALRLSKHMSELHTAVMLRRN